MSTFYRWASKKLSLTMSVFLKEPSTSLYLFIIIRMLVPPYVGISSVRSTLTKWTVFSSILVFIHFILILESCATSGVHLERYQTSMMKHLAIVLSQKCTIINIWQGNTYDSADSFLNIFPLSLLGYLNEQINIFFLLNMCSYFPQVK